MRLCDINVQLKIIKKPFRIILRFCDINVQLICRLIARVTVQPSLSTSNHVYIETEVEVERERAPPYKMPHLNGPRNDKPPPQSEPQKKKKQKSHEVNSSSELSAFIHKVKNKTKQKKTIKK